VGSAVTGSVLGKKGELSWAGVWSPYRSQKGRGGEKVWVYYLPHIFLLWEKRKSSPGSSLGEKPISEKKGFFTEAGMNRRFYRLVTALKKGKKKKRKEKSITKNMIMLFDWPLPGFREKKKEKRKVHPPSPLISERTAKVEKKGGGGKGGGLDKRLAVISFKKKAVCSAHDHPLGASTRGGKKKKRERWDQLRRGAGCCGCSKVRYHCRQGKREKTLVAISCRAGASQKKKKKKKERGGEKTGGT